MAGKSTYLVCTRKIEGEEFTPEPGDITFLRVAANKDVYTPEDIITEGRWKRAVITAATIDEEPDKITGTTGDILFFVHGYNNDEETVLWRTRALQKTLAEQGWKGLVVGFDWPSDNFVLNYLEDRSDAAAVAQRLIDGILKILIDAQFPEDPDAEGCTINVHMLGHSTGAFVIMEAFANATKNKDYYHKPWRISQVAFIAGDVASDSLGENSDWAKPMYDRILRLTNYSNGFDKVLGVSNMKRLGTSPRAGRVGLPLDVPRKAVNVDCSEYFRDRDPKEFEYTGTYNHSWYVGDPTFALDLAMTLEGGIDRKVIPTRREENGSLILQKGKRPEFQSEWDNSRPAV